MAFGAAGLDDPAGIHDVHPTGVTGGPRRDCGDDDQRHVEAQRERLHQLQYLRLNVTSSAVVGSSADDQLRMQASATAIITL